MNCPKCKTEVSNKDVTCPNCGLRLVIECPKCKSKVRLGSASCKTCGYVFVKFCPRCNSANYVSSPTCRKCFYVFEEDIKEEKEKDAARQNEEKRQQQVLLRQENKEAPKDFEKKPKASYIVDNRLEFLIDFINLPSVFKKFKEEEFKNKVLQNIKTSIKIAFGANSEFYKENIARFKISANKNNTVVDKIDKFNAEMAKFNSFLNETLGSVIQHKFVILLAGEIEPEKPVMQLAVGHTGDIVTSKAVYEILSNELSLVKISPDSYKAVNMTSENQPVTEIQETDENSALEKLYNAITSDNNIKGISINAPRGSGKTHILGLLYEKLKESDVAILAARCSAMSQVAPFGLIQDVFLNLFNLSFAPENYKKTVEDLRELIKKHLPDNFDKEKIEVLINILYPIKEASYEDIYSNKETAFENVAEILEALSCNTKILFAIDDFDLIDEMSFEFLIYLVKNNFFMAGSKFLVCYRNQNALNMYIPAEILPKENCLDITLKKREIGSARAFIKKLVGDVSVLPRKITDQIIINSKGDLAYVGQVLYHLIETKRLKLKEGNFVYQKEEEDYFIPKSMADIIQARLDFLHEKSVIEFVILNMVSFLGGKFTKSLIAEVIDTKKTELESTLVSLMAGGYISKIDEENYSFKNSLVWTNIYILARNNEEIKPYLEALLNVLLLRTISSPAICALLAQSAGNKELALALWTRNLKLASAIGDSALYIISQKQSLVNLEELNLPDVTYIKNNIYERLGKLTCNKNPIQAIDYLSNAIVEAKSKNDSTKVIELSGYLVLACKIAQKYPAVIETVDNLLSIYEKKEKSEVQCALIKTRKLDALIGCGNYEEVINIVNTSVNNILPELIKTKKKLSFTSKEDLYETWLNANIALIEAYTYQGNPLAFELLEAMEKEIYKDSKIQNSIISKKFKLACALSYTMKGIFAQSDEILHGLIKEFSKEDTFLISKWNMITLFNKVLKLDFENIKEDLFEAVTYANNNGDNFVKNILKTVLAYVILEEGEPLKALEICQEQMNYFSNEKIALGALIAWYISAKATMQLADSDKAIEICEKSMQIAQSAKIGSIWFKSLFQILMSTAFIAKGDLESAKMHIELASQDINQNELNYFLLQVIRYRAVILQDSLEKIPDDKKEEAACTAQKMFEKALSLSNRLALENIKVKINKELTAFKALCKLKRINLKD